jgi:hypothetical protein
LAAFSAPPFIARAPTAALAKLEGMMKDYRDYREDIERKERVLYKNSDGSMLLFFCGTCYFIFFTID